jgi:alpha-beta hydrolase superfamily lysophospholipase
MGAHTLNKKLNNMTFASYNKKFDPSGSEFQWLSRDKEVVDKYEKDPWCGFVCSNSFYFDLLTGVFEANDINLAKSIEKNYPILLISGSNDPVGNYGKGVLKVKKLYEKAGLENVDLYLVENARHEVLNEIDKEKTYEYLYLWLKDKL